MPSMSSRVVKFRLNAVLEATRTALEAAGAEFIASNGGGPRLADAAMSKPVADGGAYHPEERDHSRLRLARYWRNALTRGIEVLKQTQLGALGSIETWQK